MRNFVVHRPDEDAMGRILSEHPLDAAGTAVRLAWLTGLLRSEIVALTWDRVSFLNQELELADRRVPLSREMCRYLAALSERQSQKSERVLLSDRLHRPMRPQPVSLLVRRALDEQGQTEVRLIDLRHDFVIRQLGEHDWQYVSRETGIESATLNQHFAEYLDAGRVSTRIGAREAGIDELRLWKLLQDEGTSVAGLALHLTWQAGLMLSEIVALTWRQVDLKNRRLCISENRTVTLSADLVELLQEARPVRLENPDAPVVLSPRSCKPMPADRVSRVVRAALVRAGIDNVSLRDLRLDYELRAGGEDRILQHARTHGAITRNELMDLLGVSRSTAYVRLSQLTARGRLIRVGTRYYPPDTIVQPEQQRDAVVKYISMEGVAYREDIARLLHIRPPQCSVLLKHMVEEGTLCLEKQKYTLRGA